MDRAVRAEGEVVFGRFRLERLVGEGGMGAVWAARVIDPDAGADVRVALKFLKRADASPVARRRFAREAHAAAAVTHPHVRHVREILGAESDAPALVMELLEGESLATRLGRDERLSVGETAAIAVRVVSAVGAAHAAGVIHRDLKPANVFLTTSDPPGVKVLDFGIAKWAPTGEAAETLTESDAIIGTPSYMAPEQIFGERTLDHRVDVWALGILLYQCLSGVLPTRGDNVGQVMKLVVTRPIRSLAEIAPHVPDDLADIVTRCLDREPRRRPSDLREVFDVVAAHTDVRAPAFGAPALPEMERDGDPPRPAAHGDATLVSGEALARPSSVRRPWLAALPVLGIAGVGVYLAVRPPSNEGARALASTETADRAAPSERVAPLRPSSASAEASSMASAEVRAPEVRDPAPAPSGLARLPPSAASQTSRPGGTPPVATATEAPTASTFQPSEVFK